MKRPIHHYLLPRKGKFWSGFRSIHPIHKGLLAIVAISSTLFAVTVLFVWFGEPELLSSISANTEIVSVIADGTDQGAILLDHARLFDVPGMPRNCSDGIFVPSESARVTIVRQLDGPLTIEVAPNAAGLSGDFRSGDGTTYPYRDTVWIRFNYKDSACQADAILRIPLSGVVTIGDDFRSQMGPDDPIYLLLSGHIDTYARAVSSLFGFSLPSGHGALYPVGSVTLPAGARLRECVPAGPAGKPAAPPAVWSGYAEARLVVTDVSDRALQAELITTARQFALTTPGGEKTAGRTCGGSDNGIGSREDVISISLLARIIGDPNLAAFGAAIAFILLFIQVIMAVLAVALQGKDNK